jgi:hypothetical protein
VVLAAHALANALSVALFCDHMFRLPAGNEPSQRTQGFIGGAGGAVAGVAKLLTSKRFRL